jgi:hypothetical protein
LERRGLYARIVNKESVFKEVEKAEEKSMKGTPRQHMQEV